MQQSNSLKFKRFFYTSIISLLFAGFLSIAFPCLNIQAYSESAASAVTSDAASENPASNLVLNPGFEENESTDVFYWDTWSWQDEGTAITDTTTSHTGKASVKVINETATDTRFKQTIKARPNTYYKLSCWAKTDNAGPDGKGANLSLDSMTIMTADLKGSNDWTYLEMYGVTGDSQDSFTITLGLGGYSSINSGTAWFDDVSVEALEAAPEGVTIEKLYTETAAAKADTASNAMSPTLLAFIILAAVIICALIYMMLLKKPGKTSAATATGSEKTVPANNPSYSANESDTDTGAGAGTGTGTGAGAGTGTKTPSRELPKRGDYIIIAAMTIIYLIIAVLNLGSLKAPQTFWTPTESGESVIIDFGREVSLSRVYYYGGIDQNRPITGKYRLQAATASASSSGNDLPGEFTHIASVEKLEGDIFTWKYTVLPDSKVRFIKIIVDTPGGTLNEMAFFEKGSTTPLTGFTINAENISNEGTKPENLFDESDTVDYYHTYFTGMIFDEIYHARTAYENLHSMPVYEWTHPPLGKILISLGILVFGMVPFGWRIVGTLFGVAMIPLMYLFGFKLFKKRFYAFCSAFLMMFDFMHFGLTRIATIDVYGTFFIILMYYFMFDYFNEKSYELGFKPSLKPLFLSGLFFGIGAACKWIGVYAGGGLAFLFFLSKYLEYRDYAAYMGNKAYKLPNSASKPSAAGATKPTAASASKGASKGNPVKAGRTAGKPAWLKDFVPVYMIKTGLYCIVFFVVMPVIIYMLSYIPYFLVPGSGSDTGLIWRYQQAMYKYHSFDVLNATHPFSSFWWEWPLMRRPLETYAGSDLPQGISSTMTIMGNPAIWWIGIIAVVIALVLAYRRKDKFMLVIFAAIAFQYLPWVGVTRIVFIYHFFSVVPFMILSIVYCIKVLLERYPEARYLVWTYLAIVMILFIMFYPVLSGLQVERSYVDHFLQWFKEKWVF
ncbi:MAG: phospholipid carrier-dependent glycosyltransferase [Clostridiales bacterium]|nr:phospholipid carrier-dependent glycosyltransferase [Clostridiales bacterium]